jgi:hypothetical protein
MLDKKKNTYLKSLRGTVEKELFRVQEFDAGSNHILKDASPFIPGPWGHKATPLHQQHTHHRAQIQLPYKEKSEHKHVPYDTKERRKDKTTFPFLDLLCPSPNILFSFLGSYNGRSTLVLFLCDLYFLAFYD